MYESSGRVCGTSGVGEAWWVLCICILLGVGSDSIRMAMLLSRPSAAYRGAVLLYACEKEACLSRNDLMTAHRAVAAGSCVCAAVPPSPLSS